MTVKMQEIPQQEPRAMHGLGLGYAVSPTGADHMHNIYDRGYTDSEFPKMKKVAALGILEPVELYDLSPAKVRLFIYETNWLHMVNSIGMCMFMPYNYEQVRDIIQGITGWNISIWELLRAGERIINLARLFNVREGFTIDLDTLPKRFSKELKSKKINHAGITPSELYDGVRKYYGMMGWNPETGIPSKIKLQELDIAWAAEYI
jgi:aldehyde:ferredoxin oxidoreductase